MSTTKSNYGITEHCEHCNRDTQHAVQIELRTESDSGNENAAYSREPYRVAECKSCGTMEAVRMNNV